MPLSLPEVALEETVMRTKPTGNCPQEATSPPPPPPWDSWQQVRDVRDRLDEVRWTLTRRETELSEKEDAAIKLVLSSPLQESLLVAYTFMQEWYGIWKDEQGRRRTVDEARARFQKLRDHQGARSHAVLRRLQEKMTEVHFQRMSVFLRDPRYESTSNGAERMGRQFRHLQAPHFNLRAEESLRGALKVGALLSMQRCTGRKSPVVRGARRGRPPLRRIVTETEAV